MRTLYVETSALLRVLFGEATAPHIRGLMDSSDVLVSSVLTVLEAGRALRRAEADGTLSAADCSRLDGLLAAAAGTWSLLEITAQVRSRAAGAFPVEPVRTLDAVHLASALELLRIYPDLVVLSFDRRILDNLGALGLSAA